MYRGYLTRKRMRLATLDMLKDSSLDSFEEELELEGDSKSKQDFQRLYAKLEGWRINADKKISSKKSGYGLMRARSNLVSEEALKLSELAANRDAYKAEEKHYLVRNIIFKVTFSNRKMMRYTNRVTVSFSPNTNTNFKTTNLQFTNFIRGHLYIT